MLCLFASVISAAASSAPLSGAHVSGGRGAMTSAAFCVCSKRNLISAAGALKSRRAVLAAIF